MVKAPPIKYHHPGEEIEIRSPALVEIVYIRTDRRLKNGKVIFLHRK